MLLGAGTSKRKSRGNYSRKGCLTCAASKVKCNEDHPRCHRCTRLNKDCSWPEPRIPLHEKRRGYGALKSRTSFTPRQVAPAASNQTSATTLPKSPPCDVQTSPQYSGQMLPFYPISVPLTTLYMESSSSVILGTMENDGLYFYENTLAKNHPGKKFGWSAFAMLRATARNREDIMRLLLAWSLLSMAQRYENRAALQSAHLHFQQGARTFIESLQAGQPDHCASAMAFWLLQLCYRTAWDDKACASMKKLSVSMLDYVKRYGLFDQLIRCTESRNIGSQPPLSLAQKGLFSFFMIFAIYEEVAPEFSIAGGELSDFILSDENLSLSIFSLSRTCHEQDFGSAYPAAELVDDIERSKPLELNLHAHIALQQMNRLRKCDEPTVAELMKILDSTKAIKDGSHTIILYARHWDRCVC